MPPDRSDYDPEYRPRKETRRIVPAISMSIRVDFHASHPTAEPAFIGRLWDISSSGACLLFPPEVPIDVGHAGPITFHHPSIGDAIQSHYHVAWVDRLSHAFYCGGVFVNAVNFESTFLATLMRRGDDAQGRRLTDLRQDLRNFPGFR